MGQSLWAKIINFGPLKNYLCIKILSLVGNSCIEGYTYGDNVTTLHANDNDNGDGNDNKKG